MHPHLSPASLDQLFQRARDAARQAYAPYSHFRVGAALLLTSGETVAGCNVENASYRLTTCAEQNAIAAAVGLYGPGVRVQALAVANLNDAASEPCGACRQTLAEFAAPECVVLYPGAGDTLESCTLADLLPHSFHLARS